ncbi:MAG: hypothetical protein CLLPBCKN_008280 [Chroococcidiopsis cubana SAG 39.79]|nr:hypothetical protein [Chroococcidiopsis cubana SAG 39.79]
MLNLRSDNPFVKFKTRNIFILLLILIVEFVLFPIFYYSSLTGIVTIRYFTISFTIL